MKTNQIVLTAMVAAMLAATFTAFTFRALGDNSAAQPSMSNYPARESPVLNKTTAPTSVERRLEHLEQLLTEERAARQALEKMLGQSNESKDTLSMSSMIETMQQEMMNNDDSDSVNREEQIAKIMEEQEAEMLEQMQPEFKIQELVNAGFNKDEASWIVSSETEVQLEQLQAQYDARRKALNGADAQNNLMNYGGDQLRKKLGDDYYERYLESKGMPTSVSIGSIMNNSPGASAGLLPGDDIVAYDNKRVFSAYGLNRLTATGKEGENVLIEVKRNGESVQLTIPRGPIGVQANQYGRRR